MQTNLKKYLFISSIALSLAFTTPADAEPACANGYGTLIIGNDRVTRYCLSPRGMNWWSTFAWCDAAHGTLIDVNIDCDTVSGAIDCPNLSSTGQVWARNTCHPSGATMLDAGGLGCSGAWGPSIKTYTKNRALCRGNY